jgi:hypothetical protein
MRSAGIVVVVTMLVGCGTPTPQKCTPGATQACLGFGTCSGVQTCSADGQSWGACVCASNGGGGATGGGFATGGGLATGGGGGTAGTSGNVVFLWNFAGATCASTPAVTDVVISVPGETLSNGGAFPCSSGSTDGIQLLNFAAGSYSFTIEGRSGTGAALYTGAGTFTVNGNVTVTVTLNSNSNAPGGASITWTFPPSGTSGSANATCTQTSGPVSGVDVSVDNGAAQTFACTDGQAPLAVSYSALAAGSHTIDLQAHDAAGFVYYRSTSTFSVSAGSTTSHTFALPYFVGSAAFKWSFSNGVTQLTCAQAGITGNVYINFHDAFGWWFADSTGQRLDAAVPCLNGSLQGAVVDYMYGGTYDVYLSATDVTNRTLATNAVTPPTLTVTAGNFPIVDVTTPVFVLAP